jgi:hypothetical protein
LPICHDVVIVEAKHAIPLGSEKRIASRVALLMLCFKMLRAIDLYDQPRAVTDKVNNERTNRILAPKACAMEPVGTYGIPDDPLGIRQIPSQRSRADALPRWHTPSRFS